MKVSITVWTPRESNGYTWSAIVVPGPQRRIIAVVKSRPSQTYRTERLARSSAMRALRQMFPEATIE